MFTFLVSAYMKNISAIHCRSPCIVPYDGKAACCKENDPNITFPLYYIILYLVIV